METAIYAGPARGQPRNLILKRAVDIGVAMTGLVLMTPLLVPIILAIKLEDPGPALFRQTRIGYRGKPFILIKLRTMRGTDKVQWATPQDRVTTVGRFLRWSKLDEIPQLTNVLKGEMSLVGPRPNRPEIFQKLVEVEPLYEARNLVLPGITGAAQVAIKAPQTIEEHVSKFRCFDLPYVENPSVKQDIKILIKTITMIFQTPFRNRAAPSGVSVPLPEIPADSCSQRDERWSLGRSGRLVLASSSLLWFILFATTALIFD